LILHKIYDDEDQDDVDDGDDDDGGDENIIEVDHGKARPGSKVSMCASKRRCCAADMWTMVTPPTVVDVMPARLSREYLGLGSSDDDGWEVIITRTVSL
jgi:hypothetical protein